MRRGDSRGQSEVLGNVLLVGVGIVVGMVLAVSVFSLAGGLETGPSAEFEFEYDPKTGALAVTQRVGATVATERLELRGGPVAKVDNWAIPELKSGLSVTYYARPGDTVDVVWRSDNRSKVLDSYRVPTRDPLEDLSWLPVGSTTVDAFRSSFAHDTERGLQWRARTGHVAVAAGSTGDSWLRYVRTLPENDGTATVRLHFRQRSFEDSGYDVALVDASGEAHTLWCSPSGNPNPDDWGVDVAIDCPSGAPTIDGEATRTLTVDGEFAYLVVTLDMENEPGTFGDEARFYELEVETD